MGEVGKELLRERIKNKRVNEGLEEIPFDLFAKKPKYDLSSVEKEKLCERRQRNKEAAEKSRKKKKEEFEQLQIENDQLQQDKCELAAMIETLKNTNLSLVKENSLLRVNNDQLKRWIGKRAELLGLSKHSHKDVRGKEKMAARQDSSGDPVLHGDPSMHNAGNVGVSEELMLGPRSPASSSKSASPPPPNMDQFQPVGIRTTVPRPHLQTPWLVEQPATEEDQSMKGEEEGVVFGGVLAQPPDQLVMGQPEGQPVPVSEDQQVIYLPKDTILIVQGPDGQQQMLSLAPGIQHVTVGTPEVQTLEILGNMGSTMAAVHGDMKDYMPAAEVTKSRAAGKENVTPDTTSPGFETSEVTAVESLLKLGYKIEKPQPASIVAVELAASAPEESTTAIVDHNHKAPNIITMPATALESTSTVTITTTPDSTKTCSNHLINANPQMNRQLPMELFEKFREFGYVLQAIPTGSG